MRANIFWIVVALACPLGASWFADAGKNQMQLPVEVRQWFLNPDGSCVQCSMGMCGVWSNVPAATTLLWDTAYGPAERRGTGPDRLGAYCRERGIPAFNVTGSITIDWLEWASKTGRFAGIAAGIGHFQTLYGRDREAGVWFVCDNNWPHRIESYTNEQFERLHYSSGKWVVVLDTPAPPAVPSYSQSE